MNNAVDEQLSLLSLIVIKKPKEENLETYIGWYNSHSNSKNNDEDTIINTLFNLTDYSSKTTNTLAEKLPENYKFEQFIHFDISYFGLDTLEPINIIYI